MEHLLAPLFLYRGLDEFGRPQKNSLDEFGMPSEVPMPARFPTAAMSAKAGAFAVPAVISCGTGSVAACAGTMPAQHVRVSRFAACGLSASPCRSLIGITHKAMAVAAGAGISAASASPRQRWMAPMLSTGLGIRQQRTRGMVDRRSCDKYTVALHGKDGLLLTAFTPERLEYRKTANKAGTVRLALPKDFPLGQALVQFTEGYLYRRGEKWQGLVPEKREIGPDQVLECLTFEALLARWRLPGMWNYKGALLSDALTYILETRYETHSKTNAEAFGKALLESSDYVQQGGFQQITVGRYEAGSTTEGAVTFEWAFNEPVDIHSLRYRMFISGPEVSRKIEYWVSLDGATWLDWKDTIIIAPQQGGEHELSDFLGVSEYEQVRKVKARLSRAATPGYAAVKLYGIELLTRHGTGFALTHGIAESDRMPWGYSFDNATAMDALFGVCSDTGYSMSVTPGREVKVERIASGPVKVLVVNKADAATGHVEVLEAFTRGESEIANALVIKGYGQGTGANTYSWKDEGSIARYGKRTAKAAVPAVASIGEHGSMRQDIAGETGWPRPELKLRFRLGQRGVAPLPASAGEVELNSRVAVVWPGRLAYGHLAEGGAAGWYYVTEEQRSWTARGGEEVVLKLSRKPAPDDKAAGVTQIPVPVDSDTTAVRVVLSNARR